MLSDPNWFLLRPTPICAQTTIGIPPTPSVRVRLPSCGGPDSMMLTRTRPEVKRLGPLLVLRDTVSKLCTGGHGHEPRQLMCPSGGRGQQGADDQGSDWQYGGSPSPNRQQQLREDPQLTCILQKATWFLSELYDPRSAKMSVLYMHRTS